MRLPILTVSWVPSRRRILQATGLVPLALVAVPADAQTRGKVEEMAIGRPDAPVTIVEYASMTCPYCARFHQTVLPRIRKELVDTGKVRLVYRDFPLDALALRAAVLARCAGPDRFFTFTDMIYARQEQWVRVPFPVAALRQLGRLGGISDQALDTCLVDRRLEDSVLQSRKDGQERFQIDTTPAFLINGRRYRGAAEFDPIRRAVEEAGRG